MKKKTKIVENKGITKEGTDYTVYIMNKTEKLFAIIMGFIIGAGASWLYFDIIWLSIVAGVVCSYFAISAYKNMLFRKRQRILRIQFRDMLESLSNSFTVGMTASRAFRSALEDMKLEHGNKAYITKELELICVMQEKQGMEIKDLLNDFAKRSGIDDIASFASVFEVATNLAGDKSKVVRETRNMINDKIEVELEIATMVTGQRNQLNILAIMPVVMSLLTRSFSVDNGNGIVLIIKSVALGLFIFAYWLGTRIVNIKV